MPVATQVKKWTLAELHSLPDDGNRYELVRGELFVTPAPSDSHETVSARLTRILDPYVDANGLGFVYRPRAVIQFEKSQVEPDLMVRQENPGGDWAKAPIPVLVVEILSRSTRRRDQEQKRQFYLDVGVGEYWIVDRERRAITVVRRGTADVTSPDRISWSPVAGTPPLVVELDRVFG